MLGISFSGRINRTQYLIKSTIITILSCLTMAPMINSNSNLSGLIDAYKNGDLDSILQNNNMLGLVKNLSNPNTSNLSLDQQLKNVLSGGQQPSSNSNSIVNKKMEDIISGNQKQLSTDSSNTILDKRIEDAMSGKPQEPGAIVSSNPILDKRINDAMNGIQQQIATNNTSTSSLNTSSTTPTTEESLSKLKELIKSNSEIIPKLKELIKSNSNLSATSMISNLMETIKSNKKTDNIPEQHANKTINQNSLNQNTSNSLQTSINNFLNSSSFILSANIILTIMFYSVGVRRGHDLGISGWATFILTVIPIINIIVYGVYFAAFKGTSGSNKYN